MLEKIWESAQSAIRRRRGHQEEPPPPPDPAVLAAQEAAIRREVSRRALRQVSLVFDSPEEMLAFAHEVARLAMLSRTEIFFEVGDETGLDRWEGESPATMPQGHYPLYGRGNLLIATVGENMRLAYALQEMGAPLQDELRVDLKTWLNSHWSEYVKERWPEGLKGAREK